MREAILIGVVVPAHHKKSAIKVCLGAILDASSEPFLAHQPVRVVVVLDCCTDDTQAIPEGMGAQTVQVSARRSKKMPRHLKTAFSDSDGLHHIQSIHQEGLWVLPMAF